MSRSLVALLALVLTPMAAAHAASTESDAVLRRMIHDRLLYDARVQVTPLAIETVDGEVTLRGPVTSLAERAAAVEVAAQTPGVRALHNELTVRPARMRSDEALRDDVVRRIRGLADINGTRARVAVQRGTVVLGGVFPSLMALDKAVALITEVEGARDLRVQARIVPPVPIADSLIAKAAAEALLTDARLDATQIEVGVRNGIIRLEGTVPSLDQVVTAESIVRTVTGARGVSNGLTTRFTRLAPPVG